LSVLAVRSEDVRSRRIYTVTTDASLADIPGWLLGYLEGQPSTVARPQALPCTDAAVDTAGTDWLPVARSWLREQHGTERIPEGRRQDTLCKWVAGKLRRAGLAGAEVVAVLPPVIGAISRTYLLRVRLGCHFAAIPLFYSVKFPGRPFPSVFRRAILTPSIFEELVESLSELYHSAGVTIGADRDPGKKHVRC
jgi:hypothetical protein